MLHAEAVRPADFRPPQAGAPGRPDDQPVAPPVVPRREIRRHQRFAGPYRETPGTQRHPASAAAHDQRFRRTRIGEGVGTFGRQCRQQTFGLASETARFVHVLFF
ncbi:hypothetical protein [Methylorubrum extorquens]